MALTGAVGAINVKVSADATGFNATMNKVGSKVAATASKVRESGNTYAKWGAVAAAAAFAVGTAMVKNQMKVLDALAKTSDALGVQQKQLQALQHVAELTGTGAAQLGVNLERMQRRIGEVARKGGQAGAALEEIGIAAKDMIALPADEQLVRISQAMQGVDNASIRASIAMDLFGRDGVRMLKMMEQLGKDGLAPTVDELNKLGVALTRIDTAKVEQANDTLFRTQQVMDGVVNKVAVKLSPLITALGENFLDSAKDANGFNTTIVKVMKNTTTVVGYFANALHGLQIIFKSLELASKTMGLVVIKVMQGAALAVQFFIDNAINRVNTLIDNVNLFGANIKPIKKFELSAVSSFNNLAAKATAEVQKISAELNAMAGGLLPSTKLDVWVANAEAAATRSTNALASSGVGGGSVGMTDEEKAKMQEKLDAISQNLMSESEIKKQAFENDLAVLQEALALEFGVKAENEANIIELKRQREKELTSIEERNNRERLSIIQRTENAIQSLRASAIQNAIGLLDAFAGKSKAAAIAAIVLNKGLALAQNAQNTLVAQTRALAELGPIAGPPAASAIGTYGTINAGLIAATGLAQAASVGRGGGSSLTSSGGLPAQRTTSGGGSSGGGFGDRNVSIAGLDPSALFSGEQVRELLKNLAGDGADFTFLNGGG